MGMHRMIKLEITTSEILWPHEVVNVIQKIMEAGAVKGKDDWVTGSPRDHIECAFLHIQHFLNDEAVLQHDGTTEDHLAHAFTRLMMAIAIRDGFVKEEE